MPTPAAPKSHFTALAEKLTDIAMVLEARVDLHARDLRLSRRQQRIVVVECGWLLDRPKDVSSSLPIALLGPAPEGWSARRLAAAGVRAHWATLASVTVEAIDLLLAQSTRTTPLGGADLRAVLDVAANLNAERNPDRLLTKILRRMRELTGADAGTLYVVEGEPDEQQVLRFRVAQNDTLGLDEVVTRKLAIDHSSIAGYVVLEGQPLNVEDAYQLEGMPYTFNRSFDEANRYRTVSILTVPLQAPSGEMLGAVQLINRRIQPGLTLSRELVTEQVGPFTDREQEIAVGLAGAASIALLNTRLSQENEMLLDGFVRAASYAVDARDPCTSGHSMRVAQLSVGLANAVVAEGRITPGRLATLDGIRQIEYAALLHDFGKIGVKENVLLKAKRLYQHEMRQLLDRLEIIGLSRELEVLRRALDEGFERAKIDAELSAWRQDTAQLAQRLCQANEPAPLSGETRDFIHALSERVWRDSGGMDRPYLTPREVECFTIPYGSLTAPERAAIETHVVHTERFLEQVPWGRRLKGVARIAGRHHEKLDGSGYPGALVGEAIPLPSRIITVVDIYDALTASDRPYKSSLPHDAALDILWSEADRGKLDTRLVKIFQDAKVHSHLGS